MKTIATTLYIPALSLGFLVPSFAGDAMGDLGPLDGGSLAVSEPSANLGLPDAFSDLVKVSGNLRTRYEFREQDGFDPSNAVTARARVGLGLGEIHGFSAFGEIEATHALAEDFEVQGATTTPNVANNTIIADPNNVELNQAYVQYKYEGFLAKYGLQRIIRNNSAFIGNVGWRQNEQTFNGAQVGYSADNYSFSYVYADRVQRIFGDDATGALKNFDGDFHFIDGSFEAGFGKVGGYAYLIDVENNLAVGESNTYGGFVKSGSIYAELAFQNGTSTNSGGDYDAIYGHVNYTKKMLGAAFTAGIEYLGDDFKTPLATVHKFNGFADAFIGQRIGLNSAGDGLSDVYLRVTKKGLPGGVVFKGALHYFANDSFSETYGYEADAVLVKKFSPSLKGVLKAAYYIGEDGSPFQSDIKQVSAQLDYSF